MSVPPPDPDFARLSDMLTCARAAVEASRHTTRKSLFTFSDDAVKFERWIEIIGEAARNVSEEFKAGHTHIPWRRIIATRHIIAHEYGRVNYDTIWRIVTVYLPELVQQLEPLVPDPLPDPEPESES